MYSYVLFCSGGVLQLSLETDIIFNRLSWNFYSLQLVYILTSRYCILTYLLMVSDDAAEGLVAVPRKG